MDKIDKTNRSHQENIERLVNPTGKKNRDMTEGERVQMLQRKLYLKAKQDQGFRFYVLYDKVFIPYVLKESYTRVRSKGGSPGIDGQDFKDIEQYGEDKFLKEIKEELRTRQYRPSPVKRVWIEKPEGGKRPLGIPTIKDRVVQMACKLVIEPIFEADFEESSYGFRPKRSAGDAIIQLKRYIEEGNCEIYDADISKYFDTIPHEKLIKTLEIRISDRRIIELIKLWLKAPVYEEGNYTGGRKSKQGIPQGGVISPLLANIYLHLLDRIVNASQGMFSRAGIRIVRYADDFVMTGKKVSEGAINRVSEILERMGLTINGEKSRKINVREMSFKFLGFEFRYDRDLYRPNKRYLNIHPSEASCKRLRQGINTYLKHRGHYRVEDLVEGLNRIIRGWFNYFDIQGVSYTRVSKRDMSWYLQERLYRYFCRKSQRKSRLYRQQVFEIMVEKYGLLNPLNL